MKHLPDIGDIAAPPFLPNSLHRAHHRQRDELRCRPRLPVPVLVLHHHQRAGPQVALSLARQRRADHPHELRSGHRPVLHHRRQFRPQQGLGSDLRPHHQAARRGRHGRPLLHPGRHALPQDSELHRQIEARRRHPRVHRAREHQPRESDRRQEAAEQDHRIPQDAARMEAGRHHHLRGLHSRLPERYAGVDPPRPRDHQERAAARHARVLHAHAAAGLGGPQGAAREGGLDGPRHEQIRRRARRHRPSQDDARRSGSEPIKPPGASTIPTSISRRSSAAPMPAASTSAR